MTAKSLKIICVMMLLMGVAASNVQAAPHLCPTDKHYEPLAKRPLQAMLYAVRNCETKQTSYVFGTFHTSAQNIINKIAYVKPYITGSKQAWFEIDLAEQNAELAQKLMLLPPEAKGLKEIVGSKYFTQMVARFQAKNPIIVDAMLDRYKPWAAAVALQVLEIDLSGVVMDDYLQRYASGHEVQVKPLENAAEQLKIFDDLSEAEQVILLKDAIDNYDEMAKISKELTKQYLAGNLQEVVALGEKSMKMSDAKVYEKLEDKLLHQRNNEMAEKLIKALQKDNIFIAVGALHLGGETGLLTQFEKAGYGVYGVYVK
jgi:uncharacterized protein YbaP (TraB family)